jgi:hypothetical protein
MSRTSILKRSIRTAVGGFVFVGLLSTANATDAVAVFPAPPSSATADHASIVLTSHLPWLAPVGHRQPQRADAPQSGVISAWERQQQQLDRELDRKLIICRGC